eukprot:7188328-Prymnesium_polylepis.2
MMLMSQNSGTSSGALKRRGRRDFVSVGGKAMVFRRARSAPFFCGVRTSPRTLRVTGQAPWHPLD